MIHKSECRLGNGGGRRKKLMTAMIRVDGSILRGSQLGPMGRREVEQELSLGLAEWLTLYLLEMQP
jgi:hypothetical protein